MDSVTTTACHARRSPLDLARRGTCEMHRATDATSGNGDIACSHSLLALLRRALALSTILVPVVMLSVIFMGILGGCGASSSVTRPTPPHVVSAAVTMTPSDYKGACSGKRDVTFKAQLSAYPNNLGCEVHYRWRSGYSVSDGVITFEKGEGAKRLPRAISYARHLIRWRFRSRSLSCRRVCHYTAQRRGGAGDAY